MTQIKKDKLCHYCMGCCQQQNDSFSGVRNCKNFTVAIENWQELMRKELKSEKKYKNRAV